MKWKRSTSNVYDDLESDKENSVSKSTSKYKEAKDIVFGVNKKQGSDDKNILLLENKKRQTCKCLESLKVKDQNDKIIVCPYMDFPRLARTKREFDAQANRILNLSEVFCKSIEDNCIFQETGLVCGSINAIDSFITEGVENQIELLTQKITDLLLLKCWMNAKVKYPEILNSSSSCAVFEEELRNIKSIEDNLIQMIFFTNSWTKRNPFAHNILYSPL